MKQKQPPQPPQEQTATRCRYSLLLREIDSLRAAQGVSTVALMLIQLSGLEEVNRRFGYLGGDKVLEEFARRLWQVSREQDRTFEINGRTFAVLIHNPLHEGHAVLAAEQVARLAGEPVVIGSGHARVKARVGISLLPEPADSGEELLRQCELAVQIARSRDEPYVVFTPGLSEIRPTVTAHTWFDIEEALKEGEFELFYQPKVAIASGRLVGAEALVRWQSPRAGYIAPGYFMPVIENTQEIRSLLWFSLNSALRQASVWAGRVPEFTVAVNLAAGNLADEDLADVVEGVLNVWNLPPGQLILELTEGSLMRDPAAGTAALNRLRALGTRTAIDDFGTGYSSLSYLKNLPADELKIDKSFIQPIAGSDVDRNIVAAIIQLSHAVGLAVVAEGIEEAGVVSALSDMGCDVGQGYYFGVPMPAGEFERLWIESGGVRASA